MRRWAARAALFVISVCAALSIAEAATRLLKLAPQVPSGFGTYQSDNVLPFRRQANIVRQAGSSDGEFFYELRTNREGFRDVEHARAKSPGVFRILGLGDSYTEGSGAPFEETYLYRLEQMLNAAPGRTKPVEIVKAGQSRYWTEPERLLLETVGVRYKPDLILVAFTDNDVTDTYVGWNYQGVREGYLLTREAYELGHVGLWLYLHSHVARLVLVPFVQWRLRNSARGNDAGVEGAEALRPNGKHEPDWLKVESEFEKMIADAGSIGARIVLVHIPTNDFDRDTAGYPGERLSLFGKRRDVPVIDTRPALLEAAKTEQMYWKRDIHCTPAGYRVIAETIYAGLVAQHLVP